MKKIHFKLLFFIHSFNQLIGIKDKNDNIIKIWYDNENQNTCLFLKGRSGLYDMPVGRRCNEDEQYKSDWLASYVYMEKYGISGEKKKATIYTLVDVVKCEQN